MARHWIKLWVEMLSDPKVARLPDQQYRKFIEVLLLAGYKDDGGKLPAINDIAWLLHMTEEDVSKNLQVLEKVRLVHKENDDWIVTNFDKRQETPQAKSMRKLRSRQKEEASNSECNSYTNDSLLLSSLINNNKNKNTKDLITFSERVTGLKATDIDSKTIVQWEKAGVIADDIVSAIQWRSDQGLEAITSISQLDGGVRTAKSKRFRKSKKQEPPIIDPDNPPPLESWKLEYTSG